MVGKIKLLVLGRLGFRQLGEVCGPELGPTVGNSGHMNNSCGMGRDVLAAQSEVSSYATAVLSGDGGAVKRVN